MLVRPILEMIFDEGPKQHELSYGLPGQSFLENKNYSNRRIYGVGQNFYQKEFFNEIVKKARLDGDGNSFSSVYDGETQEESLAKYYCNSSGVSKGGPGRRKKHTAVDLILED